MTDGLHDFEEADLIRGHLGQQILEHEVGQPRRRGHDDRLAKGEHPHPLHLGLGEMRLVQLGTGNERVNEIGRTSCNTKMGLEADRPAGAQ